MKINVIGDPHGTDYWKKHLDFKRHNIVLGDYFDNWKNDWENYNQIDLLQELIDYKKQYPDKLDLLWGNHDLAYLIPEIVSGHQGNMAIDIKEFLLKNFQYFDIAVEYNGWVFSHAGFSAYWMKKYGFVNIKEVNEAIHYKNFEPFKFYAGDYSYSGENYLQGPTWLRPQTLQTCAYYDKQVVGHTATDKMKTNHLRFKGLIGNKQELIIVDKNDHTAFREMEI